MRAACYKIFTTEW